MGNGSEKKRYEWHTTEEIIKNLAALIKEKVDLENLIKFCALILLVIMPEFRY